MTIIAEKNHLSHTYEYIIMTVYIVQNSIRIPYLRHFIRILLRVFHPYRQLVR